MPNRTFRELRENYFDGSEPFMTGGHQILKIRRGVQKQIPTWANDDKAIKKFLLRSFPKLQTNDRQRRSAARWVRIIHLHFRAGWTRGDIAEELHLSLDSVRSAIRNIKRAASGIRARGTGPNLGVGHRQKGAPSHSPLGGSVVDAQGP